MARNAYRWQELIASAGVIHYNSVPFNGPEKHLNGEKTGMMVELLFSLNLYDLQAEVDRPIVKTLVCCDRLNEPRKDWSRTRISQRGVNMELPNFQDILKFAISREEAAISAYGNLSKKAQAPGLKKLLLELQEEEKNHKRLLKGISKKKVESFEIKEVPDLKITDYLVEEAPEEGMNFQDLLIFAAKKEQEAVDLYTNLKSNAEDEELINLFQFLIQQEKTHKLRLEKEYEKHVLEWD